MLMRRQLNEALAYKGGPQRNELRMEHTTRERESESSERVERSDNRNTAPKTTPNKEENNSALAVACPLGQLQTIATGKGQQICII